MAEVRRPLLAVSKMTQSGRTVVLQGKDPYIKHEKTGQRIKIRKEGNVFVADFWVKIPKPPGITGEPRAAKSTTNSRNSEDMEVDNLKRVRFRPSPAQAQRSNQTRGIPAKAAWVSLSPFPRPAW